MAPVPETPAVKPAATPSTAPPTVIYKATNGNVSFNHQQHAANNACNSCHSTEAPAKIVLGKDKAHLLCKGCHQQQGSGPTQCTGCHKKG
ncbi:MAG: cytochrome C [Deltaproteobacteria bacterium HGW-Deltaproteobacteria-4]|nr:MAG: cytochrome C [Deltaproteobacteria bacterium HGW-Deltaproteobacteria-4]